MYVLENPALPGLVKIGHTHRPPHKRAAELSRTAVPLPFEVNHARFFWNAPAAERAVHQHFAAWRPSRRREFFHLPPSQVIQTLDALDHNLGMLRHVDAGREIEPVWAWRVADPDWGVSAEGLEEQWGWAEEELASPDPAVVRQGWSRMEALSSYGWAEGTWRLSEAMMRKDPSTSMAHKAAWVLDAAQCQGHPSARVRAAWLRSFWGPEEFSAWRSCLDEVQSQLGSRDAWSWPEGIRETLLAERGLWPQQPERQLPHDLFRQAAALAQGRPPGP